MLIGLLVIAALQAAPAPQTGAAPRADVAQYVVGPNDVLNITVFNQAQLSGKFPVEGDGTIGFPLLGRIVVGGLSVSAVEDELRRRLTAGYLTDPHVTVTVEQYRSQQLFVMGEVKQPGNLQFTGSMTLIEALARVGSVTEKAGTQVIVMRASKGAPPAPAGTGTPGAGSSETIVIDLKNLQTGELSQNLSLHAGDTIFVPRAATVFVTGSVRTAGEYDIRPGMTVRQVIAKAGGVTDRGSMRRIQIIRRVDGKEVTIGASLETPVEEGDTVVVRERFI